MKLQIFVGQHCSTCGRSVELGEKLASHFPGLEVEIVDLDEPGAVKPSIVFAVPTFVLDGELLCVGNQDEEWLKRRVEKVRKVEAGTSWAASGKD